MSFTIARLAAIHAVIPASAPAQDVCLPGTPSTTAIIPALPGSPCRPRDKGSAGRRIGLSPVSATPIGRNAILNPQPLEILCVLPSAGDGSLECAPQDSQGRHRGLDARGVDNSWLPVGIAAVSSRASAFSDVTMTALAQRPQATSSARVRPASNPCSEERS